MKKSAKKRPVGRPPGRKAPYRPVLSIRVDESFYEEVRAAAGVTNRTISEEIIHRARETKINLVSAPPDDSDPIPAVNLSLPQLRNAMRAAGFVQLPDFLGAIWIESGLLPASMSGEEGLALAGKAAIKQALREVLAEIKGEKS